jgi:hypothetical protein
VQRWRQHSQRVTVHQTLLLETVLVNAREILLPRD